MEVSLAILARFVLALAVVFGTYNPEGVSYYHWLRGGDGPLPLKAFVGVLLLIAWLLLLETAQSSLGTLGLVLAAALSVGFGWARTRQKLTGRVDAD